MSTPGAASDPNRAILVLVARALGELCEELVFVGGCATGLLVTAVRAQAVRMTEDVDLVAQVTTASEYHAMEARLAAKGFKHDLSADAPICRWRCNEIEVDLMPSGDVLGFHNRWYPLAIESAQRLALDDGLSIRLVTAPVFIGTKLEAFKGRGNNDFLLSHDLEDILTVVDGRPELADEMQDAPAALRQYVAAEFRTLMNTPAFLQALAGHLPGDSASQQRLPGLLARLRQLSQLA
ncbi:MAG: nucleotidyl transferase AbiEii/AbiGii toxin family protein [Pseudomonadota bacterium]